MQALDVIRRACTLREQLTARQALGIVSMMIVSIYALFDAQKPGVQDRLELRPLGTRRAESVTVLDVYRWALRCRACRQDLERARAAKARIAQRLADRRQAAAERRLVA